MAESPDLTKIVGLIMENPHLIEEISSLVKNNGEKEENTVDEVHEENNKQEDIPPPPRVSKRERRAKLLSAMKPYLKEERARGVDTVMTIADMLDALRSK